jgi:acyl-CoA hydrolase
VISENIPASKSEQTNRAFFTFVAVDQSGTPIDVPEIVPETEQEKEFFEGALRRRQLRLVLAKRMNPEDAQELKSLFK